MIEVYGVALLFVALAVFRKSGGAALGVLIISMLVWPEFVRAPIGIVQMSVPRFVAFALLIKFISNGRHREINYGKADTLAILLWAWTIIAAFIAVAEMSHVTEMIGRGLDTLLMYFIARMAFVKREDVYGLFGALGLTAIVMCAAGVYEAITWTSPYHKFTYGNLRAFEYSEVRYGMLRAQASTMVSIYFGMAMMLVTGLLWSIRAYVNGQFIFKVVLMAGLVATLSSLASGPWMAIAALFFFNLFFSRQHLIKPVLRLCLVVMILAEIFSNRHFYSLIDYLALDSASAWYRTRLLEIAVSQWQDYWIVGVGSNWPHHWAQLLDTRQFIDIVNNFVIIALYGGLPALFMYLSIHVIAIRRSIAAYQADEDAARRKLLFGLAATLLALDFSSMSVGLFGPPLALSFILVGMMISVATAWR